MHQVQDAKCFSLCVDSHLYRQQSDNFIPSPKIPTYGPHDYKEEGSCTVFVEKQGLVETDS